MTKHKLSDFLCSDPEHHVHFDDSIALNDEFETENSVTYRKSGDATIIVHLGFLQHHHRYLIDMRLPAKWLKVAEGAGDAAGEQLRLVPDGKYATNVHCKLVGFHLDGDDAVQPADAAASAPASSVRQQYCNFKVEYFAHDEPLLKEELKMVNSQNDQDVLKFVITARVLGRGKGTPMLRTGIHCIGSEELPDATGFDSDASHAGDVQPATDKQSAFES